MNFHLIEEKAKALAEELSFLDETIDDNSLSNYTTHFINSFLSATGKQDSVECVYSAKFEEVGDKEEHLKISFPDFKTENEMTIKVDDLAYSVGDIEDFLQTLLYSDDVVPIPEYKSPYRYRGVLFKKEDMD